MAEQEAGGAAAATGARRRRTRAANSKLVRRIHVWTSMLSLVVILFFGATGILLNHEDWTLGAKATTSTAQGTVPTTLRSGSGFDTLTIAQYVKDAEHLKGSIVGNGVTGSSAWVSYQGPGYNARITADTTTGAYRVSQTSNGWVAQVDDIHRAKNTGTTWRVVNDLAGGLLVLIGLTGLLITWLTRARNRRRDLALGAVGLVLALLAIWSALR